MNSKPVHHSSKQRNPKENSLFPSSKNKEVKKKPPLKNSDLEDEFDVIRSIN